MKTLIFEQHGTPISTQLRRSSRAMVAMRRLPGFQPACLSVWTYVISMTNAKTQTTAPTQLKIATALRLTREHVCRAIAWLRHHGFLATHQTWVDQVDGSKLRGKLVYRALFTFAKSMLEDRNLKSLFAKHRDREKSRSTVRANPAKRRCDLQITTTPAPAMQEAFSFVKRTSEQALKAFKERQGARAMPPPRGSPACGRPS